MNMISDNVSTEELSLTSNGLKIFARAWRPATQPRAILAICHGFNSHSGQYEWFARQIAAQGIAVYGLDLHGRGLSEGERFFVENVSEYVADLSTLIDFAKDREGRLPTYLLGHSAGGVISCTYTLENADKLAGLICESFAFKVPAPDVVLSIVKAVSHVAPRLPVLKLKNEDFSRDPSVVAELNSDALVANETQPSITVAAMARADDRLKRELVNIEIPVLIMHGTADKATLASGSSFFFEAARSADKTLKLYDGHFHDLLSDIGKEGVVADISAWLNTRISVAHIGV